jgi:hypothetical protein
MKVHPAMFMKTKERGKVRTKCQESRLGFRSPKPVAYRRGQNSNFWLLTSGFCFKNEGASGDLYENKRQVKICGVQET